MLVSCEVSSEKSSLIDKAKDKVKATILEHIQHYLSILNITHSRYNIFAWLLKPIFLVLGAYGKKLDLIYIEVECLCDK